MIFQKIMVMVSGGRAGVGADGAARRMQLDAVLGAGLLAFYLCFLAVRLANATGALSFDSFSLASTLTT